MTQSETDQDREDFANMLDDIGPGGAHFAAYAREQLAKGSTIRHVRAAFQTIVNNANNWIADHLPADAH